MTVQRLLNFYDKSILDRNYPVKYAGTGFTSSIQDKVEQIDTFWKSETLASQKLAESLKNRGNECVKQGDNKQAIQYYRKALLVKPDYVDVYYNLGKAYRGLNDLDNAISSYKKMLEYSPNDIDALTNIGECYKEKGDYKNAKLYLKKTLKIDKNYDLANRQLLEIENLELASINPLLAAEKKKEQAENNLKQALSLACSHYPPEVIDDIKDITFVFDSTSSLSGVANIAQYENSKRRIVVTDKYIWAAPQVVAAYIVHEIVHGRDKDPYSSIREEQDAYRESVKFWIKNNKGVKDPEMDYASSLYMISPEKLDQKVAEIYSARDKTIPEFSPNHGMKAASAQGLLFKLKGVFASILKTENSPKHMQIISEMKLIDSYYR